MNLRDWLLRARALVACSRVERELDDELPFNVARETHRLVAHGMDRDEARLKASARFGSTALAADRCRDERGTAFVHNTVHDVLYAFRMFGRAPLVGATIVLTVALGLGLITVLFTVFNVFVFRVDTVPDLHELFAVERPPLANHERPRFTRPQYDAPRARRASSPTSMLSSPTSTLASNVHYAPDGQRLPGFRRRTFVVFGRRSGRFVDCESPSSSGATSHN